MIPDPAATGSPDGDQRPTAADSSPSERQDPTPGTGKRKRRARVISQPQRLNVTTELTGSFSSLPRPESVERANANSTTAERYQPAPPKPTDPLGDLRAKDEQPTGWGETPEDFSERMKREKPPHWG